MCGKTHKPRECPAYGKKCAICQKPNHFALRCNKKKFSNKKKTEVKEVVEEDGSSSESSFTIDSITNTGEIWNCNTLEELKLNSVSKEWTEEITISDVYLMDIKLDTGADCNILPVKYLNEINKKSKTKYEQITIPICGINYTPAQILMSRNLRSIIPSTAEFLKPIVITDARELLIEKQNKIRTNYNKTAKQRKEFKEGEKVLIWNFEIKKWTPGKIVEKLEAPRSYLVLNNKGNIVRRNSHHLRLVRDEIGSNNDDYLENENHSTDDDHRTDTSSEEDKKKTTKT
ncbi:hypothetical protein QE152_g34909 [Popillia japonica]|uniref:Uncharacterized protein n=1 Tax=Popillia japonica TaxID=7064 RepID=A0AAW1ITC4_POPJA